MRMKSLFFSTIFLLVAACSWTAMAAPLEDLSITSVDLAEESAGKAGDEHIYVTVTRVDDLIDDDGSLLAERVMAVRVTFDVMQNQLRCNGVPIDIGVSSIQVEAQMAANPSKLTIASEEDVALLADQFDVGLATVEITASVLDQMQTEDGLSFRRIAVQETITEINHEQVVQTEAGQQILDVFDNGSLVKWSVDPLTGFLLPGPAAPVTLDEGMVAKDRHGCASVMLDPLVNWWNAQSSTLRGALTGAFCAILFLMALAVRQLIVSASSTYEAVPQDGEEAIWQDAKHDYADEKRPVHG